MRVVLKGGQSSWHPALYGAGEISGLEGRRDFILRSKINEEDQLGQDREKLSRVRGRGHSLDAHKTQGSL